MGLFARLLGLSAEKEHLIRRLLHSRLSSYSSVSGPGRAPDSAYSVNSLLLMGVPEATIVTCVESWAHLKAQGLCDNDIANQIASFRRTPFFGGGVEDVICRCVRSEHGARCHLTTEHLAWCIHEARAAYRV